MDDEKDRSPGENDEQEPLSNDPEEQLRIENDLLRLQLQAETGAKMESFSEIPPDVENIFLNHILSFERQLDKVEEKTIFEIIGSPKGFKKEEELDDKALRSALKRLEKLLLKNDIEISYGTDYPERVKYKFLTEELFLQETQKFEIPNMINHFIYEEFHPNHYLSLETLATEFLNMWLQQQIDPDNIVLSETWRDNNGSTLSKDKVLQKIKHLFDAYPAFENGDFEINDISFELLNPEAENSVQGTGQVKGTIHYDATLETKEAVSISGDFTLKMEMTFDYWTINNIKLPAFEC